MLYQQQRYISPGVSIRLRLCLEGITIMMHKDIKFLHRSGNAVKVLMYGIYKFNIRLQSDHTAYQKLRIDIGSLCQIVTLGIGAQPILLILPGIEKPDKFRHILKPLIVVQKKKPLSLCLPQSRVAGLGKVIAPLKVHNLIRVLLDDMPYLLPTACIHQNQLRRHAV